MTYKIQTFITLAVALVLLVFGAGLLWQNHLLEATLSQVRQKEAGELLRIQRRVALMNSYPVKQFSYDYSYWDEMVDFVASNDSAWAAENIDVGLQTFITDHVWIVNNTGRTTYSCSSDSACEAKICPIIPTASQWQLPQQLFIHTFMKVHDSILEIYSAPIQPSSDMERQTMPLGLMVCARHWTEERMAEMTELMGCRATLYDASSRMPDSIVQSLPLSAVACIDTIYDRAGLPIALLLTERQSPMLEELLRGLDWMNLARPIFGFFLILSLFLVLHFFVSKPLALLSQSLSIKKPDLLDKMRRGKTEFAQLAKLITLFFNQQDQLQLEIRDREQAEAALKESLVTLSVAEERYRRLVEMSPDAIFMTQKGLIAYANVRAATMLKLGSAADLNGKPVIEFIDSDFREIESSRIESVEKSGLLVPTVSEKWRSSDGAELEVEVVSSPIMLHDQPACLTVVRDISDRIRNEQENQQLRSQLEVAQRMESLAVLAGGVAHDLNNMLGPLVAYPELVRMDIPEDSPAIDSLTSMEKAATQAVEVVQDLLALARRGRYEMIPLNLNDLVMEYCESPSCASLRAQHPHIKLELQLEQESTTLIGSSSHLLKVIMNLITNAFDAIKDDHGVITVTTSSRQLDRLTSGFAGIPEDTYVMLTITDTGVGISKEDSRRIFEPYFSKKKMGTSGSGLGLAVVYGILKDHHGYYDVLSEVGRGSTFILYFPASKSEVIKQVDDKDVFRGTERILVVDDVAQQREVASRLLESLGYTVDCSSYPDDAIQRAASESYDLIVLDMILESDLDGLDTFRAILKRRPSQRAIVVSGFSETERVKEMLALGAGGFVKKPYTRASLSRAVRKALDGVPSSHVIA